MTSLRITPNSISNGTNSISFLNAKSLTIKNNGLFTNTNDSIYTNPSQNNNLVITNNGIKIGSTVLFPNNTAGQENSGISISGSIIGLLPSPPILGDIVPGNRSLIVNFTPPSNNGGSPIVLYTVICNTLGSNAITGSSENSPITINGLTNGVAYTVSVIAINGSGNSNPSTLLNSTTPFTVPNAPTIGTATYLGNSSVRVSFTAPTNNGGNTITHYTATATSSPDGFTVTSTSSNSPITVSGLNNDKTYTFTVYATNNAGNGATSTPCSITPNQLTTRANKTYDGTKVLSAANIELVGVFSGDTVAAAGAGEFELTGVGNNLNYTLSGITLTGNKVANYFVDSVNPATNGVITPATINIIVNADAKLVTTSDALNFNGVSYSGFIGSDTPSGTLVVTRSNTNTQAAGTYTGVLQASGLNAPQNYVMNYIAGDYTIVPADKLLIRVENAVIVYGTAPSFNIISVNYLSGGAAIIMPLMEVSKSGNSFQYADDAGGTVNFTLGVANPVTSAGNLVVGNYTITATVNQVGGDNFSDTVTVIGALTVKPPNTTPNSSTIGLVWTSNTSGDNNRWYSVTYGNGLFVAVAIEGLGNRVMTSPDGINWTYRTSAADSNSWSSVTYAIVNGNGLFVAVAYSGSGNRVMTSPDGINWTSRTSAADNSWICVTYGMVNDENGLFVAVAYSGSGNRVMTSPDGINWTSRTSADNNWNNVTYAMVNGNGLFVAVGDSGSVMTSQDGINWTSRSAASNNNWNAVTYGSGLFVAVAYSGSGNRVMTSPDGINWTSRTSADNWWTYVTYGTVNGNGLFVAVAYSESGLIMTSS